MCKHVNRHVYRRASTPLYRGALHLLVKSLVHPALPRTNLTSLQISLSVPMRDGILPSSSHGRSAPHRCDRTGRQVGEQEEEEQEAAAATMAEEAEREREEVEAVRCYSILTF